MQVLNPKCSYVQGGKAGEEAMQRALGVLQQVISLPQAAPFAMPVRPNAETLC